MQNGNSTTRTICFAKYLEVYSFKNYMALAIDNQQQSLLYINYTVYLSLFGNYSLHLTQQPFNHGVLEEHYNTGSKRWSDFKTSCIFNAYRRWFLSSFIHS